MTPDRIAWMRLDADAIDRDLPPQKDPHEWCGPRATAAAMRWLADEWERNASKSIVLPPQQ